MIGHYIEDDALDAFSLIGLINGESDLAITTSTSLENFSEWVEPHDVDFVLLDINRPDSKSMQSDVARVREHSRAAVIFITGDEAKYYRDEAVVAGAQAVIEKENLTADTLQEVLLNVVADRSTIGWSAESEHELVKKGDATSSSEVDPVRLGQVIDYVSSIHAGLASSDASEGQLRSTLALLSDAAASLKACYATSGASEPASVASQPLPSVVRSIQESALRSARQRKVRLVFQMGTAALEGISNLSRVELGLRHLLHSAILASGADQTVSFSTTPTAEGFQVTLSTSHEIALEEAEIFERRLPDNVERYSPAIAMTLAVMLLELQPGDISIFSRGSLNTIIVEYSQR